MSGARCPYRRLSFYHANVSLQYIHLLADVALLIIPAIQVQKLRLNRAKKCGLTGLFMFGIFVCVATIAVIVYSTKYDPGNSEEFSWNVASIFIWTIAEVNLAIASSEQNLFSALSCAGCRTDNNNSKLVCLFCARFSSRSAGIPHRSQKGRRDYRRYPATNNKGIRDEICQMGRLHSGSCGKQDFG